MRCSIRSTISASTIATLICVMPVPVVAEEDASPSRSDHDRDHAAMLTRRASTLYKAGKFDAALSTYALAYEAYPAPELLFNMGQCEKNLGDDQQAIFFYSNYLRDRPDAPNREVVEELVKEARSRLDARARFDARVAAAQVARAESQPSTTGGALTRDAPSQPLVERWWFWPLVAGAVLATGTTIYLATDGPDRPTSSLGNVDWQR